MGKEDLQRSFDFDDGIASRNAVGNNGYRAFELERQNAIETINKRFGIFLNARVRVKLIGWDAEFSGKLVLTTLAPPTSKKDEVPLRIDRVCFDARDIEYCIKLE